MKTKLLISLAAVFLISSCGKKPPVVNSSDSVTTSEHASTTSESSASSESSVSTSVSESSESSEPSSSLTTSVEPVETRIYFNLTEYGLFDGQPGEPIAAVNLLYGKEYTALSQSALPDSSRITHKNGLTFAGWVSQAPSGGLVKYDKMPATPDIILEAWFEEGNWSSFPSSEEPIVMKTIYFIPGIWNLDGAKFKLFAYQDDMLTGQWFDLPVESDYIVDIPSNLSSIIFFRLGPSMTQGWTKDVNYWNRTNVTYPGTNDIFKITAWGGGGYVDGGDTSVGKWSGR